METVTDQLPAKRPRRLPKGQRRPIGRPTLFTPALGKKICKAISKGIPQIHAAHAVGIRDQTVIDWYNRGCVSISLGETDYYSEFAENLDKAKARHIQSHVKNVDECSAGGFVTRRKSFLDKDGNEVTEETRTAPEWTASKWLLQCADRENFGERKHVEHSGQVQQISLNLHHSLSSDEAAQLASLLGRASLPAPQQSLPVPPVDTAGPKSDQ